MQTLFGRSRLISGHANTAAHSITQAALPLLFRQSSQVASAIGASGTSTTAACLLARRLCQSVAARYGSDAQHVQTLAQTVLNSSRADQVRGFAVQAIAKSSSQGTWLSCFISNGLVLIFAVPCNTVCTYAASKLQLVTKRQQSTLTASLPGAASTLASVSLQILKCSCCASQ